MLQSVSARHSSRRHNGVHTVSIHLSPGIVLISNDSGGAQQSIQLDECACEPTVSGVRAWNPNFGLKSSWLVHAVYISSILIKAFLKHFQLEERSFRFHA